MTLFSLIGRLLFQESESDMCDRFEREIVGLVSGGKRVQKLRQFIRRQAPPEYQLIDPAEVQDVEHGVGKTGAG